MANGVDTRVQSMQSSGAHPAGDRLPSQPQPRKLIPSHNPMLPPGQRRNLGVNSVRPF